MTPPDCGNWYGRTNGRWPTAAGTHAEGAFARIFTITGLHGILPRYATVQEALAQPPAARPPHRSPAVEPTAASTRAQDHGGLIVDGRNCEQCGAAFVPRREHARFCSPACRAAWNREHLGDPAVQASALTWSLAAMSEATALLPAVKTQDHPEAFAAIEEAVWWITMVDATLLRHHPAVYDSVLAAHTPAGRALIVETLAGLRFVRNRIGRGTGLEQAIDTSEGWRTTGWTWKPIGEPALAWLPPRAQAWEQARHRAYQARLAGHTIGKTFGHAVTFLALTGTDAASLPDPSATKPPTAPSPAQASDLGGAASSRPPRPGTTRRTGSTKPAPKTTVQANTLAGVTAISSFFDPYTADGSGGSLHVFSATPSGDYETYWFNTASPKTTLQINNL